MSGFKPAAIGEIRGPFASTGGDGTPGGCRYFYVYGPNGWIPHDRRKGENSDEPARQRAEKTSDELLRKKDAT